MSDDAEPDERDLTDRKFYRAEQEAGFAEAAPADTPQTRHPAYRLAFRDTDFLLREELRPVRFQLELLKTEMLLDEANIGSTLVMYGSARIPPPDAVDLALEEAAQLPEEEALVVRNLAKKAKYYAEAYKLARLVSEKSNIENGACPLEARKPDTIRFGGVPIRVVMPPRIEPKASGISTCPGASLRLRAICNATGISNASAPTLFMKPDSNAASPVSAAIESIGPALSGSATRASASTAPEVCRPRLSTSTQATVITAGWPKPAKACSGATTPMPTARPIDASSSRRSPCVGLYVLVPHVRL